MDNHIFRSAAWGFNRQDVMEYIERTQKESETNANALTNQLDEALAKLEDLRRQLNESSAREEKLSEELEESHRLYETEKTEREKFAKTVNQQEESIQALTAERDRLAARMDELAILEESVRREKEKITQLELDAHGRAEKLLEQAQAEVGNILTQAQQEADRTRAAADSEAAGTLDRARSESESILAEAREKLEDSVRGANELLETCKKISANIAGELGRLSRINGRLPEYLKGLKNGLEALREKATDGHTSN